MKIVSEVLGSVQEVLREAEGEIGERVRLATARHTERLKQRLRQDVQGAGLGRRLANTWQSKDYPARGVKTLSPAGYVFSKAPSIVSAFSQGVTIRRAGGGWLAIPTGSAPKTGGRGGGRRMSPVEVEAHFNRELRVVRPAGSSGHYVFLVMDGVTRARGRAGARGQFRKLTQARARQGRAGGAVVMFILIPQARLKKLFDLETRARQAGDDLAAELTQDLAR